MIASAGEETLVDAINRLRRQGFTLDFYATADGQLGCRGCAGSVDPAAMQLEHRVRFEGNSNPADEAVLLALVCPCGAMGLYSAAYGPATPPEDSLVLTRFAQREIDSSPDTSFENAVVHTSLRIEGANCSFCFNEAIDEVARTGGVLKVHGSIAGPTIEITHDNTVDAATLTSIVRNHVHGIEMYANEIRMIPLAPAATAPACTHS